MADFFRNKLVAGHAFHSATKVAAVETLRAHPLLEPHATYTEGLSYLREYIASLLWVDSTAFSRGRLRHLRLRQPRPRASPRDSCGPPRPSGPAGQAQRRRPPGRAPRGQLRRGPTSPSRPHRPARSRAPGARRHLLVDYQPISRQAREAQHKPRAHHKPNSSRLPPPWIR